jgi:hypothetical protein
MYKPESDFADADCLGAGVERRSASSVAFSSPSVCATCSRRRLTASFSSGVETIRQRLANSPHPYVVKACAAKDGSETCLSLTPPRAYCARDGSAREAKLEKAFSSYEIYEEKIREIYHPKGLPAYTTAAGGIR